MKPSAILFDCDGVLVDSEVIYKQVEQEHLSAIGLHYDPVEYANRFTGLSGVNYLKEVERDFAKLGRGSIPENFQDDLAAATMVRFEKELQSISGAAEFVASLDVPIAVASSSTVKRLHWKLKHTGLHHHFGQHVYSGDQVEKGKPAPDLFLFAARNLGVAPSECVVIEDSSNGVKAGVAAGMTVWGFTGGGHADEGLPERLRGDGAVEVFSSFAEMGSRFASIWIISKSIDDFGTVAMTIQILPFETADREDWLKLWEAYLVFYKASLPESVGHQTWDRIMDSDGDILGFKAADENGAMVGMVTYLYHGTTWSEFPRCYLHDLYTLPETRGQGVGRALIEAVYDAARDYGADQVYWLTQEFNYPGRILYDKVADRTPFIKYAHKV